MKAAKLGRQAVSFFEADFDRLPRPQFTTAAVLRPAFFAQRPQAFLAVRIKRPHAPSCETVSSGPYPLVSPAATFIVDPSRAKCAYRAPRSSPSLCGRYGKAFIHPERPLPPRVEAADDRVRGFVADDLEILLLFVDRGEQQLVLSAQQRPPRMFFA